MKRRKIMSMLLLIILFVVACSPYSKLKISSDISEIKVSLFQSFGSVNEDFDYIFTDEKDIKIFVKAINSANPIKGDVDMPEGDFDFLISFPNNTTVGFHLWLNENKRNGTIMKVDETASAYNLTVKSAKEINKLLSD